MAGKIKKPSRDYMRLVNQLCAARGEARAQVKHAMALMLENLHMPELHGKLVVAVEIRQFLDSFIEEQIEATTLKEIKHVQRRGRHAAN